MGIYQILLISNLILLSTGETMTAVINVTVKDLLTNGNNLLTNPKKTQCQILYKEKKVEI